MRYRENSFGELVKCNGPHSTDVAVTDIVDLRIGHGVFSFHRKLWNNLTTVDLMPWTSNYILDMV